MWLSSVVICSVGVNSQEDLYFIRITGRSTVIGSCEGTFELNIHDNFLGIRTLQNLKFAMLSNNEVSMIESICTKAHRYATKYIFSY